MIGEFLDDVAAVIDVVARIPRVMEIKIRKAARDLKRARRAAMMANEEARKSAVESLSRTTKQHQDDALMWTIRTSTSTIPDDSATLSINEDRTEAVHRAANLTFDEVRNFIGSLSRDRYEVMMEEDSSRSGFTLRVLTSDRTRGLATKIDRSTIRESGSPTQFIIDTIQRLKDRLEAGGGVDMGFRMEEPKIPLVKELMNDLDDTDRSEEAAERIIDEMTRNPGAPESMRSEPFPVMMGGATSTASIAFMDSGPAAGLFTSASFHFRGATMGASGFL